MNYITKPFGIASRIPGCFFLVCGIIFSSLRDFFSNIYQVRKRISVVELQAIGLFGGAFNPIHIGHLIQSQIAFEQLNIQKMLIVPSGIPPWKRSDSMMAPFPLRFQWARRTFEGLNGFEVWDFEGNESSQTSFTVYTIQEVYRIYGRYPTLILGQDSFDTLDRWHQSDFIINYCPIAVLNRRKHGMQTKDPTKGKAIFLNTPMIEISSSLIRDRARSGRSLRGWVSGSIESDVERWYQSAL